MHELIRVLKILKKKLFGGWEGKAFKRVNNSLFQFVMGLSGESKLECGSIQQAHPIYAYHMAQEKNGLVASSFHDNVLIES